MATFTVQGHKLRSASTRRFLVVKVKRDRWAVMEPVVQGAYGRTYNEVVRDERTGFRAIFDTHAEAVQAVTHPNQTVEVWSVAGAEVVKRSDSYETARRHALSVAGGVVLDTTNGEVI